MKEAVLGRHGAVHSLPKVHERDQGDEVNCSGHAELTPEFNDHVSVETERDAERLLFGKLFCLLLEFFALFEGFFSF